MQFNLSMKTHEVTGGAQVSNYDIQAHNYDVNRHYFLSHYFADNYDNALSRIPIITSSVHVERFKEEVVTIKYYLISLLVFEL